MSQRMRLSKILSVVLVSSIVLVGAVLAGAGGSTVSSTSVMVVPQAGISPSASGAWVSNTAYSAGQYVSSYGKMYLCVVAGTSTNAVYGPSGVGDVTDGAVTWRSAMARKRSGLVIMNASTNTDSKAYISDRPAVVGKGIMLGSGGSSFSLIGEAVSQSAYYCVVDGTAAPILVYEW